MKREYHKWFSPSLGRDMELLVFGHAGLPAIVFPTSCGRFFEFEDRGMVHAVREKIEHGHLQLFCVDSVDAESWYNRAVPPRWRIARHIQYEKYVMDEVLPLLRAQNHNPPDLGHRMQLRRVSRRQHRLPPPGYLQGDAFYQRSLRPG